MLLLVKTEASVSDWALLGVELKSPEKQLLGIGQLMDHFSVPWFPIPIFCLSSLVKFSPFKDPSKGPSTVHPGFPRASVKNRAVSLCPH